LGRDLGNAKKNEKQAGEGPDTGSHQRMILYRMLLAHDVADIL
jgi:hypothetical protein